MKNSVGLADAEVVAKLLQAATLAADNEAMRDGATLQWIRLMDKYQTDEEVQFHLESECSSNLELARMYYDTISNFLSQAESYEKEDGWMKLTSFAFLFPETHSYRPFVPLSDLFRADLAARIKTRARFEGKVDISSFGLILPIGQPFVAQLEASRIKSVMLHQIYDFAEALHVDPCVFIQACNEACTRFERGLARRGVLQQTHATPRQ